MAKKENENSTLLKKEAVKEDKNLTLLKKDFENHKGEFVINNYNHKVVRLVALGTDDEDYYWVFYDGNETVWQSTLFHFIVLKDKINKKDYDEFIRLAKLNHQDQINHWQEENEKDKEKIKEAEKTIKEVKENIQKNIGSNDKYLTDICWDIN